MPLTKKSSFGTLSVRGFHSGKLEDKANRSSRVCDGGQIVRLYGNNKRTVCFTHIDQGMDQTAFGKMHRGRTQWISGWKADSESQDAALVVAFAYKDDPAPLVYARRWGDEHAFGTVARLPEQCTA